MSALITGSFIRIPIMCCIIKGFAILTVFSLLSLCKSYKHCPTEYLTINVDGKVYDIVWKSKSDAYQSVVLSVPPCLDINNNLVWRTCYFGTWLAPKNICYRFEESKVCPLNFIQHDDECVYVTQPQTISGNCPYPGGSFKAISNTTAWMPVRKYLKYGPNEYTQPGEKFGLDLNDDDYVLHMNENDCLISTNSKYLPTKCDALYPHICSYRYDTFLYSCPKNCVSGGLGSDYCFCKIKNKNLLRNSFCKRLATPKYSYERHILHKLADDDVCWIGGLQEDIDVELSSSNLSLAIGKQAWSLHKNGEIHCAICEIDAQVPSEIDLTLRFNTNSRKLYLYVYSPESVLKIDKEDSIYCFTDATPKLKHLVEIDEIFHSRTGRSLKVFKVSLVEDGPGYYWCQAFQLPNVQLITSNKVLAYKKFLGREYALRYIIYNYCRFSLRECAYPTAEFFTKLSIKLLKTNFLSRIIESVRVFHIYSIDSVYKRADVLIHLSVKTKLPIVSEYFVVKRNLKYLVTKQILLIFFRSSEACLPEITDGGGKSLYWKLTSIGVVTIPEEVCIQRNGIPVKRQCQGDFQFGSQWGTIEGQCFDDYNISEVTECLYNLSRSNISLDVTKNISTLTNSTDKLTELDLHYLAEALSKALKPNQNYSKSLVSDIGQIIDNIMNVNTTTLKSSQLLLNATDSILDVFENLLLSFNNNDDLFLLKNDNLLIQISKPLINNITGLIIYADNDTSFSNSSVAHLYANSSLYNITEEDTLEVAAYVPKELLDILTQNRSTDLRSNFTIITTVFNRDNFFNDNINDTQNVVAGKVVSVSIPGYGDFLETSIPIVFKSQNSNGSQKCAFWNYGISSETQTGYWSSVGGDYLGHLRNKTALEICSYKHLTNFALLVRSESVQVPEDDNVTSNLAEEVHDQILTVISDVGCTLSVLGISGIFVTGLLFHSWREKVGTRILLQLCVAIFMQIIFLNIANIHTSHVALSKGACTAVGILLHYTIISEFSWMLVAAILQFFRFVIVIGPMPNRIILKATLVGWGVPLIPIAIVSIVDYKNYSSGVQGICYPKGLGLYLGVLLPIALIVLANLVVFIAVIRNIFILRVEANENSQTILKRQLCLAVLLFFLLGLPWAFGIFAEIMGKEFFLSYVFIYLFCFTATLQGFVLFLFYVILDKSTRTLWFALYRKTFKNNI